MYGIATYAQWRENAVANSKNVTQHILFTAKVTWAEYFVLQRSNLGTAFLLPLGQLG